MLLRVLFALAVLVSVAAPINPGRELAVHYCCPDLALFNSTSGSCDVRQTDAEWLPPWTFLNGTSMQVGPGTVYTLIMGYPSCAAFLYRPDTSPVEDDFMVLPTGHIHFPFYNATVPPEEACIVEVAGKTEQRLHFAVVCMDSIQLPGPTKQGAVSSVVRTSLYTATMVVSEVFFVLTLLSYWLVPEMRDLQGRTIMCTIISLFMAYLMFIIVNTSSRQLSAGACLGFGLMLHYWMLASFFWLSVVSITVYYTTKKWGNLTADEERRWFIYLSVFGWGAPFLFTLAAMIVDFVPANPDYVIKPHIGSSSCWFGNRSAELAYFFGPVTLLIVANMVMFVVSAVAIYRSMDGTQKLDSDGEHKSKNRMKMCFKVFVVMGITWVFEVLQFFINDSTEIWIIFDMINMLQGFFIFVAVVLSERRIRQKLYVILSRNLSCFSGCRPVLKTTDVTRLDEEVGQNRRSEEIF